MGQWLDTMGRQKPKDELLYEAATSGNVEAMRALCRGGAGLEWIDREGKTALIVACMNPELMNVAKVLLELGANVHAYRPGRNAGTPLHHAAKRGLEETVKLLLSHGANAFVRNDDCCTSLEVARSRGQTGVVRAIEVYFRNVKCFLTDHPHAVKSAAISFSSSSSSSSCPISLTPSLPLLENVMCLCYSLQNHICKFVGWMREFSGPVFLGGLVSQLLSKKIWVVVVPCGSGNALKPPRLELAIYSSFQDAMPRTVIALWNAKIEEPKFHQSDPLLVIFDPSTKTRHKLASGREGDKEQLQWLYDACRGITQVIHSSVIHDTQTLGTLGVDSAVGDLSTLPSVPPQNSGAMDSNGWEHHAAAETYNGWGPAAGTGHLESTKSDWSDEAANEDHSGWGTSDSRPVGGHIQSQHTEFQPESTVDTFSASTSAVPSAPPIPDDFPGEEIISYPSVDGDPLPSSVPVAGFSASAQHDKKDDVGPSSCIICWESPVEGACVPCGHMAGCMSCLNEVKVNKGLCPVCRTKIDQVIRLFVV